jgi:hypothetical protein
MMGKYFKSVQTRKTIHGLDKGEITGKGKGEAISSSLSASIPFLTAATLALSISFDVGFFYGLDIHLFTLFSLTEHTLFTLEALPIAASLGAAILTFFQIIVFVEEEKKANSGGSLVSFAGKFTGDEFLFNRKISIFTAVTSTLMAIFYFFYSGFGRATIFILTACVSLFFCFQVDKGGNYKRSFMLSLMMVLLCVLFFGLSFMIGIFVALGYTYDNNSHRTHKLQMNDTSETQARLIRSGERGILVYDLREKRLRFIKWEKVEEITVDDVNPRRNSDRP